MKTKKIYYSPEMEICKIHTCSPLADSMVSEITQYTSQDWEEE